MSDEHHGQGILRGALDALTPLGEARHTTTLGALGYLLGRPEIQGMWFNHQTVNISGYRFVRCRFDACRLIVDTPNFELHHCALDDGCVVEYGTDLMRVLKLWHSKLPWAREAFPGFVPTYHPEDQSISVV
jgi:hypothetical protein